MGGQGCELLSPALAQLGISEVPGFFFPLVLAAASLASLKAG